MRLNELNQCSRLVKSGYSDTVMMRREEQQDPSAWPVLRVLRESLSSLPSLYHFLPFFLSLSLPPSLLTLSYIPPLPSFPPHPYPLSFPVAFSLTFPSPMPSPGSPPLPPPIVTVQEPSRPSTVYGVVTSPSLPRPPALPSPPLGTDQNRVSTLAPPSRANTVSTYSSTVLEEGARQAHPMVAAMRRQLIVAHLCRIFLLFVIVALIIFGVYRTTTKWYIWAAWMGVISILLALGHLRSLRKRLHLIKEPGASGETYSTPYSISGYGRNPMMRPNPVAPLHGHSQVSASTLQNGASPSMGELGLDPLPSYTEASSIPPAYGNQTLGRASSRSEGSPPPVDAPSGEVHRSGLSHVLHEEVADDPHVMALASSSPPGEGPSSAHTSPPREDPSSTATAPATHPHSPSE
ncbi:hypothetical protein BJ684DRAFT_16536 [Piptocephalis cylindrospora]|uniref:Uncharacterized protein n=1 Tax=Piptocephalis cylindrospora TaxID=1907219 RepID=A0A4P9Y2Y4_9FUNG|nr:hypothetical protein BJ684DRAFT_16536 [Piptocephalis cylindrospora]|eukprot:RKP13024.1 hypothetical protein BJ684DRAFT_16536 [Piptocephalis cylindrospora]